MRYLAILALSISGFSNPVHADAPKAEALPSGSVLAFGDKNPSCREWTDGCVVCMRAADASHCSTPGVACQPHEILCKGETK